MDFDATAGVDWHAEHLETGGCKARIRQPKVAATCGCVGLVLLLVVMAGRGRHRERVAGTSAMGFVNHTVTVESANTVNEAPACSKQAQKKTTKKLRMKMTAIRSLSSRFRGTSCPAASALPT